jgi:polyphosphate kinase 2 (PPK2 family)
MIKGSEIRKADFPIEPLLLDRWSPQAMSGEEISQEELMRLFEAARWAPSSFNAQQWRALYARRGSEHWQTFFELLARNGIVVRKFFFHVSKKEQKRRFLERIDDGQKNWKFSSNDAAERDFWDDYMKAYEEMIQQTATKKAPWYVVPADNKWSTQRL